MELPQNSLSLGSSSSKSSAQQLNTVIERDSKKRKLMEMEHVEANEGDEFDEDDEDDEVYEDDARNDDDEKMIKCTKAAVKMIVIDEHPFSFIESDGFKNFCRYAMPNWILPSTRTDIKMFLSMYKEEKEKLKKEMKGHCLCLTTETWTSVQDINYLVVTSHFIDSSWKMQKRILSVKAITSQQGTSIGRLLEDCLVEWDVQKFLTISTDNASSNMIANDFIRKRMLRVNKNPVLLGKFMHVQCLSHILNLIVQSGFEMMRDSVASIRNAVMYFRTSPQRLKVFKFCAWIERLEAKKICILDVPTRWDSTYIMLSAALNLRGAFDRIAEEEEGIYEKYFEEDDDVEFEDEMIQDLGEASVSDGATNSKMREKRKRLGPPESHDWEKIAIFVKILKSFFQVTKRISASNYPTSWSAFHDIVAIKAEIDGLLVESEMCDSASIKKTMFDMASSMKMKYEKYFSTLDDCNQLILIALVLNPRFKIRNFEHVCQKWLNMGYFEYKQKSAEVKELLVALCDLYRSSAVVPSSSKSGKSTRGESSKANELSNKVSVESRGIIKDMEDHWLRELKDSQEVAAVLEVERYLLDPIERPSNSQNFNILEWWKKNTYRYPLLASVAKDVLAIQVSAVAAESSFSIGRRVMEPYRSSLPPKTMEALICLPKLVKP